MRKARFQQVVVSSVLAAACVFAATASAATKGGGGASAQPQAIGDAALVARTAAEGGADVLPTARTVPHWWGSTLDPDNGITYGHNMVGANPTTCSGSACSVTIEVDITPIVVDVDGLAFDGMTVLAPTLASPLFALDDYGASPFATAASSLSRGLGGVLSQGDAGNLLQLGDATMRAQFDRTGASNYHLLLHPNAMPAVTIDVPANHGTLLQSARGVVFAAVDEGWWSARIQNLLSKAEPTHLALFLTDDVLLSDPAGCCVIGYHGAKAAGNGSGNTGNKGNAPVQTFAWASWIRPGVYARPDGGTDWAVQDVHSLSHELAEWADDPFANNAVEPWFAATAPQYGCTGRLETGDPVVGIGFAKGTNTFEQGPNPNGTQSADGYYHPEDEALLPWFTRSAPNTISEPTQSPSANGGRYTFMGDLDPFPGLRRPATGC